ncbi:DUF5686 and carboxypeptidase regulatory-like domain-containing protein [Mucilaginibacter phyllosphaerae]|uniref:Carboxypeptidase-like regulatory domain-containing protein n=1 Tax=Mucilaginibacter phyllosphaerae TaxID=1812349 RepID=A0A4Y8AGQ8_9SPHI|nr:DUF5686 and carboxypeptidase regulatory-like domain-containing protein [Mucilaginibacter phyllosphaerae]MBB3968442.1 hypothetical protein [Mucilaginibacter phyllosphaerae]TEW67910.1 carboxypeptidase-like regulatory domain-containing protein [Mucilaginibacter phyllosphaerae]GGH15985.1 membrane protein [Mucilaginibacter phyllosphaerae]
MKPFLLFALFLLITSTLFAQDIIISGKIIDAAGHAVPFATVYVKNSSRGTSANSEGGYTLTLKTGQYDVQYRAMGYKQQNRKVELKNDQTINVVLNAEDYQLKEVAIRAGAEDPAYAIIRKAIKKRKTYLNEVNAYTCEVYIKGLQKLLGAPKKFLGFDVQKMARENGLDSNRRGIIYLSESQSKFSFERPDKVHEEMISSKFSGSNRAFSFNRVSDMRVNFYENLQVWEGLSNRPLISPIADNALAYYQYKYLGFTVENGETINKIQVIPRNPYAPCFSGYIYIMDDSWRMQSLGLYITKKSNINFVDTLKVNQQFFPVSDKAWMPASLKFEFTGGLFGFKFGGYFISIYKDYDIEPKLDKNQFKEVLRITRGVNKKDSAYWEQQRPIPLTAEEKTDYQKKAVLAAKRESKPYLDSLDKVNNQFSIGKFLLGGYRHRNRFDHEYYNFNSLLSSVTYNTVEGLALGYGGSFTKQIDSLNNRYFNVYGKVRYGFSNKLFNATGGITMPLGSATLSLAGGSDVIDLNNHEPISAFMNTAYTLLNRQNFEKFYQKQYASATISKRIYGGWQASAGAEWANRKYLSNTTDYSFFHPKRHQFTTNNPLSPNVDAPLFPENQSFKLSVRTTYDFSNRYETYPTGRRYIPSKYPTLGLTFVKAVKNVFGSDADYNLLSADLSKSEIPMGFYGKTSFYIGAGKFFNTKNIYYTDYRHFSGNQVLFYQGGLSKFLLLDYYQFSTGDKYLEGHLEHNFSGLLTNMIPLIRNLKLQEIININYLSTPTLKNYTELGVGFQTNIGLRVMYGTSFNNKFGGVNQAIRIGMSF